MTSAEFSSIGVRAKTHPPGYALHKYWARKPHNVVRRVLEVCGVGRGDVVVDPFCGSGVPLSEAAALGATCVGVDVNPVAVELTRTTLDPPDPVAYHDALTSVLDALEQRHAHAFRRDGRRVRHAVHATVVECPSCGARVSADRSIRRGRAHHCPSCDARLAFNLERLVATRLVRVVLDDRTEIAADEEVPLDLCADASRFDHELTPNARILAFRGMRTRRLFTARNFAVLTAFAEAIDSLPADLRPAARLTLTGACAQCSRLIAHRQGLRTGGPAWTVPGFWVPPVHVETNPLAHLRARVRRMQRGFTHLRSLGGRGSAHRVHEGDAGAMLDRVAAPGEASVAFVDPPYGDSVPYLEFSSLWNGFLGALPDPGEDIAVSNRARGDGTWARYEEGLRRAAGALRRTLRDDGRVVVTFNNKDPRAWQALLGALQGVGLGCAGAFYQAPAVVSAKAQLAPDGSYVGDVYCVFRPSRRRPLRDPQPIVDALRQAETPGDAAGIDARALARIAIVEALRANVDASVLADVPELADAVRGEEEGPNGG